MRPTEIGNPKKVKSGFEITDVSIILVCWNNRAYLEDCLDSLYNNPPQSTFDIIVVDNASTDGSQAMLREKFPAVRILQNDHNVGLSKACNQGIIATRGRYALLLNNDTIVNGDSFDAMVRFMDSTPSASAVGGQLLNPDGSFQGGCGNFPTLCEEFLIATRIGEMFHEGYPGRNDLREPAAVGWLSSACVLLRREALAEVGLFDEQFFIYGDEVDLQYRMNRAGWKAYYLPAVTTIHFGGMSTNRWQRRRLVYRGKMLFYQKNYGPWHTALLRTMLGALSISKMLAWTALFVIPSYRDSCKKEIKSNVDVLKLCWKLA